MCKILCQHEPSTACNGERLPGAEPLLDVISVQLAHLSLKEGLCFSQLVIPLNDDFSKYNDTVSLWESKAQL